MIANQNLETLLAAIEARAALIRRFSITIDSIELDKSLGELDLLILDARLLLDEEWKAAREATFAARERRSSLLDRPATAEDLA